MISKLQTVASYENLIAQSECAIVHFGFDWNSFDRTMQRTLLELAPEFGERLKIGFVDVDNNATIPLLQNVNLVNVPTLVYFRNGERQSVEVGMKPMDDIRQNILFLLTDSK